MKRNLKVLVIGSGAREHAIAYTLLKGASVEEVTVAPGTPGMELDGLRPLSLNPSNQAALIDFVRNNDSDWVFVGPEVTLLAGLVDELAPAGAYFNIAAGDVLCIEGKIIASQGLFLFCRGKAHVSGDLAGLFCHT